MQARRSGQMCTVISILTKQVSGLTRAVLVPPTGTKLSNNYTLENLLIYDATIAKKHKLNFTGLYSLQEVSNKTNQFDNTNILADYL